MTSKLTKKQLFFNYPNFCLEDAFQPTNFWITLQSNSGRPTNFSTNFQSNSGRPTNLLDNSQSNSGIPTNSPPFLPGPHQLPHSNSLTNSPTRDGRLLSLAAWLLGCSCGCNYGCGCSCVCGCSFEPWVLTETIAVAVGCSCGCGCGCNCGCLTWLLGCLTVAVSL